VGPCSGRRASGSASSRGPGPNRLFAGFDRCDGAARARHRRSRAVLMQPTRNRGALHRSSLLGRHRPAPVSSLRLIVGPRLSMRCQGWSAGGSGSVERRPAPPVVRRSRTMVSRRSIARANRSLGVIPLSGSLSAGGAGLAGRCLVRKATGTNDWPFTFTGPPQRRQRRMASLSPIPASSKDQLACPTKAGGRFSHIAMAHRQKLAEVGSADSPTIRGQLLGRSGSGRGCAKTC